MQYKGILFDFDGTLADTMQEHYLSWRETLAEYGADLTPEEYFPLEGMNVTEFARHFIAAKGIAERAENIVKQKDEKYLALAQSRGVEFYRGVFDLLNKLKERKVPMAIVTAGRSDRLIRSVPDAFLNKFSAIITAELAERGKPFPDPYLKGAEKLNLLAKECIAVENAPLGIKSAKSAGMYCVAIASTVSKEKLAEADEVVGEFADLRNIHLVKSLLD